MWNIFTDLKKLGFGNLEEAPLYDEAKEHEPAKEPEKKAVTEIVHTEEEFLFDKKYDCPICNKSFVSKTVRTGKMKLLNSDSDLKPNYAFIEPIKYDVVACPHCGYASLTRLYGHLTSMQMKLIRENISAHFKGFKSSSDDCYTFETAEERYELALANALTIKIKNSERAYLCLKLAWLYRYEGGKRLKENPKDATVAGLKEKEMGCIKMAYEGFGLSYEKEVPPICGMDSDTLAFLLSDLARRCKDYENAIRYVGIVLNSRGANTRLKERARDERELIKKEAVK